MGVTSKTAWGFGTTVAAPYAESIERTKAALAAEGFGVLSEIDMGATLKAKTGVDVGNYIILGACNPPLALRAVQAEREIGLLLPCNVIVHETDGRTHVSVMDPKAALGIVENEAIEPVATQARERLVRVIEALQGDEDGVA